MKTWAYEGCLRIENVKRTSQTVRCKKQLIRADYLPPGQWAAKTQKSMVIMRKTHLFLLIHLRPKPTHGLPLIVSTLCH